MSIRIAATKEAERAITNWQCPSNSNNILCKTYRKQLRQLLSSPNHSKSKNENIRDLKSKIRSLSKPKYPRANGAKAKAAKTGAAFDGDNDTEEEEEDVDAVMEKHRKRQMSSYRQQCKRLKTRFRT